MLAETVRLVNFGGERALPVGPPLTEEEKEQRYLESATLAAVKGPFPAFKPEIAVIALIENSGFGGSHAAPAARGSD